MLTQGFSSYWFLQHDIYFPRTCALGQEVRLWGDLPGAGKGWRTDRETTTPGSGKCPKASSLHMLRTKNAVLPLRASQAEKKHSEGLLSICTAFELSENYLIGFNVF